MCFEIHNQCVFPTFEIQQICRSHTARKITYRSQTDTRRKDGQKKEAIGRCMEIIYTDKEDR